MHVLRAEERGSLAIEPLESAALGGRSTVWLYLPPGCDDARPLPVLYLLHGAHGRESDWALHGSVLETAGELIHGGEIEPLLIVMPNDGLRGRGTRYMNRPDGTGDYEHWIARDLVAHIDDHFPTRAERAHRCIAGLSMGGFGAVNVGLRNRALYRGIASHSGLFNIRPEHSLPEIAEDLDEETRRANSPIDYIADIPHEELPALYLDCGVEDFLYEHNLEFHRRLRELGVEHVFHAFPGGHTWDYWSRRLRDSLRFLFGRVGRTGLSVE